MADINIPNREQWEKMNQYLNTIAKSLDNQVDISTWAGIQKVVRMGRAAELFPIGTQFKVNHSVYGEHLYDVVAHEYFKSSKDENAHTMTLMCHDALLINNMLYDAPEAIYGAEVELPAGTYNFTIPPNHDGFEPGTYQFELDEPLPKGGIICFDEFEINASEHTEPLVLLALHTSKGHPASDGIDVEATLGNGGVSLGTLGVELNSLDRCIYGSNNYKESAVRQFLNSSGIMENVWVSQTKFDKISRDWIWDSSNVGFMYGLDDDFLSVVGEVIVPCSTNGVYESPDSTVDISSKYVLRDKFYLASKREIFGDSNYTVEDDSVQFPYYKDATNADRVKYEGTGRCSWALRTPNKGDSSSLLAVEHEGSLRWMTASYRTPAIVPVCTIV
jgi:hypothetical protein